MKLARHIPRCVAAAALAFLLAGPPAPACAEPPQARPPARPAGPKLRVRKAQPLVLTPAWTVDLPGDPCPGVAVDRERGFALLRSGQVVALRLSDGSTGWTRAVEAPAGTIAAGDGLVFVPSGDGLVALDAGTGAPRWTAALGAAASAPPRPLGGFVLVVTAGGNAVMIATGTGQAAWTRRVGVSRVRPAVGRAAVFLAIDDGRVEALDRASGRAAWTARLPAPATALVAFGDRVYVGGGDDFLYCLAANRGRIEWRWRTGAPAAGEIAADARRVYFAALDNVVRALDRRHGDQAWKAPLAHRPVGGVFFGSGLVWAPTLGAEVAAFQASDGSAEGTSPLAGDPAGAPVARDSSHDTLDGLLAIASDGHAQWLVPGPAPLPSKPVPGLPMFAPPPEIRRGPREPSGGTARPAPPR